MWAIQRVLDGWYRIDDKRELKDKIKLLDLISDRIALEYKRQWLKIPLLPEQQETKEKWLSINIGTVNSIRDRKHLLESILNRINTTPDK